MKSITLLLVAAIVLLGCSSTTEPIAPTTEVPTGMKLVGTQTTGAVSIDLYAPVTPSVGYTSLHVRVRRNGAVERNVHVHLNPVMDMGTMKHSSPAVQPDDLPNSSGLFEGAVIFTMPGSADQWSVGVTIHDHDEAVLLDAVFPIAIASSGTVATVKAGMEKTIYTLVDQPWKVGMNAMEVIVYTTTDGFNFEPVEDVDLRCDPTKPSMGHGSPGNVHPVHHDNGWYRGTCNFTMTGDWDIALIRMDHDTVMHTVHFPVVVR